MVFTKKIKIVSVIMGYKGGYEPYNKKLEEELESLVNEDWKIVTMGCSGAPIGDFSDAHVCTIILEKGIIGGDMK